MSGDLKHEIEKAFLSLSKKKDIDKITVKDIVTECGISRQTFYYHFQDILEVSEWSFQQKMLDALKKSVATEEPIQAIYIYIHTMRENQAILRKLCSSDRRVQIETILIETVRQYLSQLVKSKVKESKVAHKDLEFSLDFYSVALTEYMLIHIEDNLDEDTLASQLFLLLDGKISIFI